MPNQLAKQTSPYLLQHAHNPVDWWPWSRQALAAARDQGKPILLSIGYSACHWCHVMAHESFEDPKIAELMNQWFINIKVDREERPDLDKVYQLSHQVLTQRPGGWPLTLALVPETLTPFFAGTYFPKESRYGMPAFPDVLRQLADWYEENRGNLEDQKDRIQSVFARIEPQPDHDAQLHHGPISEAIKQMMLNFDADYGGFTGAPKFPHPTHLELLLSEGVEGTDHRPGEMARFTLRNMAHGGLFDQIGGGFCRYTVDDRWEIPHFEKMLYDNGPLLAVYAKAATLGQDTEFRRIATETAGWVMREMQSPDGGYYSTLDADSEGGEGRFYTWDDEEVRNIVGDTDYPLVAQRFGLDQAPNFEGRWHLRVTAGVDTIADTFDTDPQRVEQVLRRSRQTLFESRKKRPRPGRDEKILTAWNAQMIEGMSVAARLLDDPTCADSAHRSLHFIRQHLWQDDRLKAGYKDGITPLPGYLDDYAFLLRALLEWLQTDWHTEDLFWARELADALLTHFEDTERGGFYFTAHDHEQLLYRPRPFTDESTPAGNAVAADALLQLGHLLGETRYLNSAERTLKATWRTLTKQPLSHTSLLSVLRNYLQPGTQIILRGTADDLLVWQNEINTKYRPRAALFAIPSEADLPGNLASRRPPEVSGKGRVIAYLCSGLQCSPPMDDLQTLLSALPGA